MKLIPSIKFLCRFLLIFISFTFLNSANAELIDEKVKVKEGWSEDDIGVIGYKQNKPSPTIIALHHCSGVDGHIKIGQVNITI